MIRKHRWKTRYQPNSTYMPTATGGCWNCTWPKWAAFREEQIRSSQAVIRTDGRHDWRLASRELPSLSCCCSDWMLKISSSVLHENPACHTACHTAIAWLLLSTRKQHLISHNRFKKWACCIISELIENCNKSETFELNQENLNSEVSVSWTVRCSNSPNYKLIWYLNSICNIS